MENLKVIFSFTVEGDNARVELNGTGEEIVSGFVMLLDSNPSMKQMMEAAIGVHSNLDDKLRNLLNSNEAEG
jgi:hypothetical protein